MRAALILAFGAAIAVRAQPVQRPTFRAAARLVQISVVVQDNGGRPVTGLAASDFRVTENGQDQAIAFFSAESRGVTTPLAGPLAATPAVNEFSNRLAPFASGVTVILLDRLNTRWDDQIIARNAVVQFLNQVRADDRIALYVLDSDALRVLHDFTSETSSLVRALSRHRSRMSGELAATEPEAPELGEAEFDQWLQETQAKIAAAMTENRIQTTSAALEAIARHLTGVRGRKNLVWLSSGFPIVVDDGSGPKSYGPEVMRAMRALNDTNIAVYPVDARGLQGAFVPGPASRKPVFATLSTTAPNIETMRLVAERTGGRAFVNSNDITGAVRRAIDDARATYLIGYYPADDRMDGRFREIKVAVNRRRVDVRYRRGYRAVAVEQPDETSREATLMQAVRSPVRATGVTITTTVARVDGDPRAFDIHIHVDSGSLSLERQDERWIGAVDVFLAQGLPNGTFLASGYFTINLNVTEAQRDRILRDGLAETRRIVLRPEAHELHVVARDPKSGAIGSLAIPASKLAAP